MAIPKTAIFVGVGSAAVVGGGVATISYLNSSQSIRDKLIEDGYQILKNDSNEWATILTHYKGIEQKDLHFEGFDGTTPTTEAEKVLKEKCKLALNNKSTDESNYKKAKHWCTEPRTLATEISKNYRLLSTETGDAKDDDVDHWNKKMEDHEKHNPETEKISDLGLETAKVGKKDKPERDKLRKKCEEFKTKKHYEKDFETTLKKATLWCAVAK